MPSTAAGTLPDRSQGEREEAIDLVPPGVRAWWRTVRPRIRRADVGALAVALGQVPFLLWVLVPGSLYLDDLRGQSYAAGRSWWPFVVQSNGTHFSPVARTIDWVTVHVAPLADWPAVVVTVAIRVALVLVVWRLLRELFGPRTALLLPLALVAITPALLPTTAWYRQAMSALLVVVALCLAAQQHLRHVRTGSPGNVAGAAVAIALGLLTWEKAVLIGPWLVVLTAAALPATTGLRDRLRRVWRARVALGVYALLTAGHLAVYLTGPFDQGSAGDLEAGPVLEMMARNLGQALVPGLLGGPWTWVETSPYYGNPAPPAVLVLIGLAAVVAGLGWCLRRSPARTAWGVAAFLSYFVPAALIVAAGRLSTFGESVAVTYRLWPDVVVVGVLSACLATFPLRGEPRPAASAAPPAGTRQRPLLAATVAVAVAVGSAVSTADFVTRWHANPTGGYLSTLQSGLDSSPSRPVRMAPVSLPEEVVPFWFDDYALEDALSPLGDAISFHGNDGPLVMPDGSGRLTAITLKSVSAAGPGPDGFCGHNVLAGETQVVTLARAAPYLRNAMVQVGVLVHVPTTVDLTLVDEAGRLRSLPPIRTTAGPHRLLARVPYGTRASRVHVSTRSPAVQMCVVEVAVVVPEPAS